MEATAILRSVRLSPQKGRLIADMIRGLPVERALEILQFNIRRSAKRVKKVLESAIANAEHNQGADIDELCVHSVQIDAGPILQALSCTRQRSRVQILKRTSHITITVSDKSVKKGSK